MIRQRSTSCALALCATCTLTIVNGDNNCPGGFNANRMQQFRPRGIAVKAFHAYLAKRVDNGCLMVQYDRRDLAGNEQPVDGLTETTTARDDDRAAFLNGGGLLLAGSAAAGSDLAVVDDFVVQNEQRRCQQH